MPTVDAGLSFFAAVQPSAREAGALEQAPFPVIACDAALRITGWNAAAERMFGHAPAEAVGRRLDELIPPEGKGEAWAPRLRGAEGARWTWTHARKDGSAVACAWSHAASVDEHGAPAGAVCFGQDVTAQVELERRCTEQEEMLAAIRDTLPVVIWRIDRQGTFSRHEGSALARFGMAQGQHVGSNIFELYPHDEAVGIRRAFAGEISRSYSEAHGAVWEGWCVPVRDVRGEVSGAIGITLDTTETRKTERELRAQLEVIERQRQVIQQLSTPILQVWDGVLTLPMVGILDSRRAADVMDELLDAVSRHQARFAILDLTGVDAMDTHTAAYLINLVQAIRLLGAEGIITGIRPSVAQTVVAIGLDLGNVTTLANLRAGLRHCIVQMRKEAGPPAKQPARREP